jgi:PAS domain-containing protein
MIGQAAIELEPLASRQARFNPPMNRLHDDQDGVLTLDPLGRILTSDEGVEKIFGWSKSTLKGRWISRLISNLPLRGDSPSYGARLLAHLSTGGAWREFEAVDVRGEPFPVELQFGRQGSSWDETLVVKLRCVAG